MIRHTKIALTDLASTGNYATPPINELLVKLGIHAKKIWLALDKPYLPVTFAQDLNIYNTPAHMTTIRINDITHEPLPVTFGKPIVLDSADMRINQIYLTSYLTQPKYFDSLNFGEYQKANIIVYFTDKLNDNIAIEPPRIIRYSFRREYLTTELTAVKDWYLLPLPNLPIAKNLTAFMRVIGDVNAEAGEIHANIYSHDQTPINMQSDLLPPIDIFNDLITINAAALVYNLSNTTEIQNTNIHNNVNPYHTGYLALSNTAGTDWYGTIEIILTGEIV